MKVSIHKQLSNKIKAIISKIVLFFLGRGIQTLYKQDSMVRHEIMGWKENFVIQITTQNHEVDWKIKKENGKLVRTKSEAIDLSISFKSIDILFKLVTGRLGVAQAYAEHRFLLKGEIKDAMSFVRVIDRTEGYLFPKFMTKGILKQIPKREKSIVEIYGRLLLHA